jgi:hypothetical protein
VKHGYTPALLQRVQHWLKKLTVTKRTSLLQCDAATVLKSFIGHDPKRKHQKNPDFFIFWAENQKNCDGFQFYEFPLFSLICWKLEFKVRNESVGKTVKKGATTFSKTTLGIMTYT